MRRLLDRLQALPDILGLWRQARLLCRQVGRWDCAFNGPAFALYPKKNKYLAYEPRLFDFFKLLKQHKNVVDKCQTAVL